MATALDPGSSLFGSLHENILCRIEITGLEDASLRVTRFAVREGLSRLFEYTLDVATNPGDVANVEKALGADATVVLTRDEAVERVVHGIVTTVAPDGVFVGGDQARTVVVVQPRLANLQYTGGHRIWQDKSVKDIVAELVAPEQIPVEWRTIELPAKRDYRTQLDESDLEFLDRLAADEGFHYFFTHDDEKATLVFTNQPLGFRAIDGNANLAFRGTSGAVAGEHVRSVQRSQRVRTGALDHRDFDFEKPNLRLVARSATGSPQSEANTKRRERRDYPGGFVNPDGEGAQRAQRRLQELRSDASTVEGAASSLRLLAGRSFTLAHHPDRAFNKELVVTSVDFGGSVVGTFSNAANVEGHGRISATLASFEAVTADTPIRPARRPKPSARLLTAHVVGPEQGDPFVDEYGRIKVQFPWDRQGNDDEHSSCWIRMVTPVAYDQGGFFSPHRVGAEVLVDFIDDDIDRPVVIGALYNALQRQPHKQPDKAALSAWIERSVPGGKGHNGITFDNTAGKETIDVHAERDRRVHVGHDDAETIGANQSTRVGANQSSAVGANRTVTIGANDATTVGADRTENVGGAETVTIAASRAHTVRGVADELYVTDGDRAVNVYKGNNTRNVKLLDKLEADNVAIHARYDVHVTGDRKIEVKQGDTTATFEGGNVEIDAAGHVKVRHKSTTVLIDDAGKVTVDADPELEVNCKGAQIKMGAGKIAVNAPTEITLAVGQSGVKISGTGVETSGPSVKSTALTGINEISGLAVKLN